MYNIAMFEKFLEELGLSEKEAQVYVALLQFENAAINEIAAKTKINRTTVYPVLDSLQKKGLVSEIHENKKSSYQAAPPERLETYVERQKIMFEEQSLRLKDMIPQMKSIQREQGEKPIIKLFQGRDGAISAYKEFFNFPESVEKENFTFFNDDMLHGVFTDEEIRHFREIRKNKKVKATVVYTRESGDRDFEAARTSVRLDEKKYPLLCDISAIDDTVIISTLGKDVSSLIIKSRDIADTLKSLARYITQSGK